MPNLRTEDGNLILTESGVPFVSESFELSKDLNLYTEDGSFLLTESNNAFVSELFGVVLKEDDYPFLLEDGSSLLLEQVDPALISTITTSAIVHTSSILVLKPALVEPPGNFNTNMPIFTKSIPFPLHLDRFGRPV